MLGFELLSASPPSQLKVKEFKPTKSDHTLNSAQSNEYDPGFLLISFLVLYDDPNKIKAV